MKLFIALGPGIPFSAVSGSVWVGFVNASKKPERDARGQTH